MRNSLISVQSWKESAEKLSSYSYNSSFHFESKGKKKIQANSLIYFLGGEKEELLKAPDIHLRLQTTCLLTIYYRLRGQLLSE